MKKWLIGGIVILVVAVSALWLSAPRIIEPQIEQRIKEYGFDVADVSGVRLYPAYAFVKSLAVEKDGQIAVARNIRVDWNNYDPRQIFRVEVEAAEIPFNFDKGLAFLSLDIPAREEDIDAFFFLPEVMVRQLDIYVKYQDTRARLRGNDIALEHNEDRYLLSGVFSGRDPLLNGKIIVSGDIDPATDIYDIRTTFEDVSANVPGDTVLGIRQTNGNIDFSFSDMTLYPTLESALTVSSISYGTMAAQNLQLGIKSDAQEPDVYEITYRAEAVDTDAPTFADGEILFNARLRNAVGFYHAEIADIQILKRYINNAALTKLSGKAHINGDFDLGFPDFTNPVTYVGDLKGSLRLLDVKYDETNLSSADLSYHYNTKEQFLQVLYDVNMNAPVMQASGEIDLRHDKATQKINVIGRVDRFATEIADISVASTFGFYDSKTQELDFKLRDVTINLVGDYAAIPQWTGAINGKASPVKIDFNIDVQDNRRAFQFMSKGSYRLSTNKATGDYRFKSLKTLQNADVRPYLNAFDLNNIRGVSGEIDMRGKYNYTGATLKTQQNVKIENLSLQYNDILLTGIQGVIDVSSEPSPNLRNQEIFVAGMDLGGIPLRNGEVRLSYNGDQHLLDLRQMTWQLAGGRVYTENAQINLRSMVGRLILQADNIDLSELSNMAEVDGLRINGIVSGSVPINFNGDNIEIRNGILQTADAGNIQYDPMELPGFLRADNEYIGMVREAIKNYSYNNLSIEINGVTDQQQIITIKASGQNPDFYDGRLVNLNLNLEGNLDDILRFNLGTYDLPQRIKDRMERFDESER